MHHRRGRAAIVMTALVVLSPSQPAASGGELIPRRSLVEDAYQLRDTIEATHPDPYLNGGGKVAFHRRFHELVGRIPERGVTAVDFLGLLRPFVAAIGDSHTGVRLAGGELTPVALPLGFRIVEDQLVVDRVAREEQLHLVGARLLAIEGVAMPELVVRQARLRGLENRSTVLAVMILRTLNTRESLMQLVPEWPDGGSLRVSLQPAAGGAVEVELELVGEPPSTWVTPPSKVTMPSLAASDVAFTFLDPDRTTALLVIGDLMRYREACELWFASGSSEAEVMTRTAHEHFHGTPGPDDLGELVAGIPAATPTIAELVDSMQAAETRNLIVDLRGNTGGNSAMREILVYLLYGRKAMLSLDNGYQIARLSPLLFEQYASVSLERLNRGRSVPLRANDYDFSEEESYRDREAGLAAAGLERDAEAHLEGAPSFWEVYRTGRYHEPRRWPEKVVVLSSASTFSSGFNVLTGLLSMGARTVGTASAQAGNSFGDTLMFRLRHSGIEVGVSYKKNVTFPDDPERGRCLQPKHPLTFDRLAQTDFDPNAEVLLALEVLRQAE